MPRFAGSSAGSRNVVLQAAPMTPLRSALKGRFNDPILAARPVPAGPKEFWYPIVRAHDGGIHPYPVSPALFCRRQCWISFSCFRARSSSLRVPPTGRLRRVHRLGRAGAGRRKPDSDGITGNLGVARERNPVRLVHITNLPEYRQGRTVQRSIAWHLGG
ncbi:hypothetical protein LZ31DRAFT_270745 [Colletotrichum somersetense]|nr:hypothetical protein LZ31DRAFT_270745 [Colletotrichum somersetense]